MGRAGAAPRGGAPPSPGLMPSGGRTAGGRPGAVFGEATSAQHCLKPGTAGLSLCRRLETRGGREAEAGGRPGRSQEATLPLKPPELRKSHEEKTDSGREASPAARAPPPSQGVCATPATRARPPNPAAPPAAAHLSKERTGVPRAGSASTPRGRIRPRGLLHAARATPRTLRPTRTQRHPLGASTGRWKS